MTKEMELLRKMLDDNNIEYDDNSQHGLFWITRTQFNYRGYYWSVIHGFCTYGGYSTFEKDKGLLELMSDAVNNGEPIGFLTAKEVFSYVKGGDDK